MISLGSLANDEKSIQIINPQALESFFQKLKHIESGTPKRSCRILQIGDSHTAGDRMSGELRALFQNRFGNSGRGMLAPGKPWKYFHPSHVKTGQSDGWEVFNSFSKNTSGIFGLTGFRTVSADPSDSMWLVTSVAAQENFSIAIEARVGPGYGAFDLKANGKSIARCPTSSSNPEVRFFHFEFEASGPKVKVELSPVGDGPVHILSWTIEKEKPGIVYDSQGIVGATADIISKWDPEVIEQELSYRCPSLILVVFGTNEGFNDRLGLQNYEKRFSGYLQQLQKAAPGANILVVGPPDANRISSRCLNPRDSKGRRLKKIPPEKFKCGPLSISEQNRYSELFPRKGKPKICRWHPALKLDDVRQIQKKVALENGFAFWDWSQIMGGQCGAHRWFLRNPPYMQPDHVHMTKKGSQYSARELFKELMRLYDLS